MAVAMLALKSPLIPSSLMPTTLNEPISGTGSAGVGLPLGDALGLVDGLAVGDRDGRRVGDHVGLALGLVDGDALGLVLGLCDGLSLGEADGLADGDALGDADGASDEHAPVVPAQVPSRHEHDASAPSQMRSWSQSSLSQQRAPVLSHAGQPLPPQSSSVS